MSSVNKAIIIGNVGKDPDIRTTQDGRQIASLSIATSESWKDKSTGERKERTEWHRVSVMSEGLANVVANYVTKGTKLYIEGQLQTRKWTDRDGQDRYTTEIVLSSFNAKLVILSGTGGSGEQNEHPESKQNGYQSDYSNDLDDDIPF